VGQTARFPSPAGDTLTETGIAVQRGSATRSQSFDRRWLVLIVTSIGSFMTLLDSTIVNVALPGIIQDFHSTVARGQLVLTVYLLALAVVIPISGFLGEYAGMKRLYMILLSAFALSSGLLILVGLHPSVWWLVGILFIRGIAMAFTFIPLQAATYATIRSQDTGRASSLFNTTRQVRASFGVAILAATPALLGRRTVRPSSRPQPTST